MQNSLQDYIFQIITDSEPVTTKEIQELLEKHRVTVSNKEINSVLYGPLRSVVIRDINEKGIPAWKIRRKQFSAAGGLEAKFYNELIKQEIVTKENSQLGFTVKNTRNNKRYHLDIAIWRGDRKYDIEIDGFDHIRADALASLERQIIEGGKNVEIEIDWMDNEKSFIAFNEINTKIVYQWLGKHLSWCIRYHEELLWPKDITRNIWLIEKGWKIMRFWNVEVQREMEKCVDEVKELM